MRAVEISGQILKILRIKPVVYADVLDVGYEKEAWQVISKLKS